MWREGERRGVRGGVREKGSECGERERVWKEGVRESKGAVADLSTELRPSWFELAAAAAWSERLSVTLTLLPVPHES